MINLDFLSFLSEFHVDKIVLQDEITISNSGPISGTDNSQVAHIVTDSRSNTYGKSCFIRARWSIDGGDNWNDMRASIKYGFNFYVNGSFASILSNRIGAISVGCNDSTIYFRTANGHHGDASLIPPANPTYTSIPHDFIIQYALYDMDLS